MRTRTGWLGVLLGVGMALAPAVAWGQGGLDYSSNGQPDPVWPLPLYHDRPETGGFFAAVEFLYWPRSRNRPSLRAGHGRNCPHIVWPAEAGCQ